LSSEPDFLTLPVELAELSEWLGEPFRRFLRLKQRNWPAKTVKQSTRQVFLRLSKLVEFFIQHYDWQDWDQLSLRWLDDYVDVKLREGLAPVTINWDLTNFRSFCRFLIDEEYNVPQLILRMKLLNTPRRLPRPLSEDQIRRLECCIQTASNKAKTEYQRHLAVRDLACFYLLWHCGLRNSEVCSLLVSDVDLQGRKLFIRDGKERKDRLVYMGDTTVKALHQHLAILPDPSSAYLFTTRVGVLKRGGLWKRLRSYGHQCGVPVTARRLRHTFASQMLAAGMPVTSLQRYLGHELLDTTMIYAEVSDPLLQQDYYQGIALLDPNSAHMGQSKLDPLYQDHLRRLLEELKAPELEPARQKEIMEQMQSLLDELDEQK
jgi:site-specific recombinase XerD